MEKPGATGEFPKGKICEDDEGELKIAIGTRRDEGVVRIEFGKRISWLAFGKEEAMALAAAIIKHAEKL